MRIGSEHTLYLLRNKHWVPACGDINNPIQDEGGGAKRPPIIFSPVTPTNVEPSPKIFLLLLLTLLPYWYKILRSYLVSVPNY